MFATFVVMAAIELSLLIDKPNARYFAVTILAVGLILRGLVLERRMKKEAKRVFTTPAPEVSVTPAPIEPVAPLVAGERLIEAITVPFSAAVMLATWWDVMLPAVAVNEA